MEFNDENIKQIKDYLLQHQQTVAVAESVTAGLLQFALSGADNAIHFFQGGITAYNIGQKAKHLHIEPIHAARCNCADGKVAAEMAEHVTQLFSSHWGISLTGYATPVPESNQQVFAYYAIAQNDKVVASGKMQGGNGTAKEVQLYYVNSVLGAFLKLLG